MNVLFDLDGTLTDSRLGIERCLRYALEKMTGTVPDELDLSRYLGPPLRDSFADLLKTECKDDIERAVVFYRERFGEIGIFENSVYAGIYDLLKDLIQHNHSIFVATSKPRKYARKIIRHFELSNQFTGIYGSKMDGRLSEKDDLIRHAMASEHLCPDDTIMVGDRDYDVRGAQMNAVRSIGVLWGFGNKQELVDAGATFICSTPSEILDIAGQIE